MGLCLISPKIIKIGGLGKTRLPFCLFLNYHILEICPGIFPYFTSRIFAAKFVQYHNKFFLKMY